MRARTLRNLRVIAGVVMVSGAFGAVLTGHAPLAMATGLLVGGVNGLLLSSFEISLRYPWAEPIRRLPLALTFLFRTGVYGAVLVGVPYLAGALASLVVPLPVDTTEVLRGFSLPLSFGFSIAINLAFTMSGLLGPRVLTSLLTGRYHHPLEERRIVLFLDLVGSTRTAEALGDMQFHRLLNQVFSDITDPMLETGGEIYRYVGDEIIITWPLARGARDAACVVCAIGIMDVLDRQAEVYRTEFGVAPRLRAALHAGPLVVGEMGDLKREIVMLGDTMNTTARIEDVCRSAGRECIASGALLDLVAALPPGVKAENLGPIALPGKEAGVELFALTRSGGQAHLVAAGAEPKAQRLRPARAAPGPLS